MLGRVPKAERLEIHAVGFFMGLIPILSPSGQVSKHWRRKKYDNN